MSVFITAKVIFKVILLLGIADKFFKGLRNIRTDSMKVNLEISNYLSPIIVPYKFKIPMSPQKSSEINTVGNFSKLWGKVFKF